MPKKATVTNMNINKTNLYRQMLKKLLITAIPLGAICIVVSIMNMAAAPTTSYGFRFPNSHQPFSRFYMGQPIAAAIAPALIAFMFIGSILFTYLSFNYMNKRSSSDFYDSLPYSRLKGYISRICAILTYQYGIIILTITITFITMISAGINFDLGYIPKLMLSYMAGSTLIVGGVVLAMSITGTLIGNLTMSFVILILPRMLLFILDRIILQFSGRAFVNISTLGIFLNPVYNIPTALMLDITRIWEYYGISEILLHTGASIYCLVLGIIYIAITALIMKKRKSELAGRCAPSKLAGHIYSALIVLPILVVAFLNLLNRCVFVTRPGTIQTCIIFVVVALVVYIMLEFIINRRLKSILCSIPIFVVMVAFAMGIIVGGRSLSLKINNYVPHLSDIESIQINENNDIPYKYKPLYSFSHLMTRDIVYKDRKLIRLLQENLEETVAGANYSRDTGSYNHVSTAGELYCKIKLRNGKTISRNIVIFETDNRHIDMAKIFKEHEEYQMYSTTIPRLHQIDDIDLSIGFRESKDLAFETYNNLRYEYDKIDDTDKRYVANHYSTIRNMSREYNHDYHNTTNIAHVRVYGHIEDLRYSSYYNINNFVPITSELCMKRINEISHDDFLSDIDKLKENLKGGDNQLWVSFDLNNYISDTWTEPYTPSINLVYDSNHDYDYALKKEELDSIISMIEKINLNKINVKKPFARININIGGYDNTDRSSSMTYIPLTERQAEKLLQMYIDKMNSRQ